MVRFIHIADVHLDTTFLNRSDRVRTELRSAIRTALERAVTRALDERVDGFLIAGDLFDSRRLSFGTETFLVKQLGRLHEGGIPCFCSTGNHDPGGKQSRLGKLDLPSSFHLFDEAKPKAVDVFRDGEVVARVVGAGHESDAEKRNLAGRFPDATEDGVPTIGLLHALVTSASGVERHDRYAPCTVEDLRSKRYAYWALGHVHERQAVDGDSAISYPGNVQGRTPKETGRRGGLLVTIDGSTARTEFIPLSSVVWHDIVVDGLDEASDAARLERRIRAAFDDAISDDPGIEHRMIRFILKGPSPLALDLLRAEYVGDVGADLKSSLGVLDVEVVAQAVRPPVDLDEYRVGQHLLGEVLLLLDELGGNDDLILDLAPDPIADVNVSAADRVGYLRELLAGMDAEAAARLLVDEE